IPIHKAVSKRLSRNPRPGAMSAPPVSSLSSAWSPKDRPVSPSEGWPGAAIVFYAYIGFDSVSTHAEEARNPSRDVPIGIIVSLALCTVLYIAVATVLTGMVPYDKINIDAPLSAAFNEVGLPWAHFLISVGALT